jgi:GTP-binding protein HflX
MTMRRTATHDAPRERAVLVRLVTRDAKPADPDTLLDELDGLTRAAGAEVAARVGQTRATPDAATLIGRGKADELAALCDRTGATLVVFDNELTPAQARNLERACGRRVIDRREVILDIFARRARTREGQLQVELAQLQYRLPRLTGAGIDLSRLGGGIGTRGPGETKLETDRRRIRHRIAALKSEIAGVKQRRGRLRARRRRTEVPTVALVGYTNAGKTTLFNQLTGAGAPASRALFATLDPLARRLKLPDARQILLSDTVGFIDRLPHQLVAAFHATLEEVTAADLLLHVIDAASPDRHRHQDAVRAVLIDVGARGVPVVDVYNKIDRLDAPTIASLRAGRPDAVCISATTGQGREELLDVVAARLAMDAERVHLVLDGGRESDRRLLADLYRHARVVSHVTSGERVAIEADVPRRWLSRLGRAAVSA